MSKSSHARHFSKRLAPSPGCTNGAFYKSPHSGDSIDTSKQLNIEWDTSLDCFSTAGVDIYLYAPFAPQSVLHAWTAVAYSPGSFKTDLVGSWWNATSGPISLQLGIVDSGKPAFMSAVPTGPMFSATFNATDFGLKHPTGAPTSATSTQGAASGGGIFQVIGNAYRNAGLPKGSIAAAVLVPLVAIIVALTVYVKFQRTKEAERRRRWSQAVDKRMSTISTEWKGLSPNAQSEAIRQSIAMMRDSRASMARMSQLYDARPISINAVGGGHAGVGVAVPVRKGTGIGLRNPDDAPAQMAQRKSTVSFAADTRFSRPASDSPPAMPVPRPSGDTQRGRASRSFHTAISADDPGALLSPKQVGGPPMLGDRDIHRQLDLGLDAGIAPALTMMQRDDGDFLQLDRSPIAASRLTAPSEAHLSPTSATPFNAATTPPSPAYGSHPAVSPGTRNPFQGFMRGPSNVLSPDAMLRAYAAREGGHGTPMAVGNPSSSPARVYPAFDAPAQPAPVGGDRAPGPPPKTRTLYAPGQERVVSEMSRYSVMGDDDAAYGGFGHAT